jgi:hypothetical protein
VSNRMLGTIAMVCAPAMLVQALLLQGHENDLIVGVAGMVFMAASSHSPSPASRGSWSAARSSLGEAASPNRDAP